MQNSNRKEKESSKLLGVITARGGSKGIPGKNVKPLSGKPLIAYTIEAAQNSGVFSRLIISTDDEGIAEVARSLGVEVPFMRPPELAQDVTPHLPVMVHAVTSLREKEGYYPDYISILQPTAPLRTALHLREAWTLLHHINADSVVSFVEIPGHHNPHWAVSIDDGGLARLLVSGEPLRKRIPRRQNLPKAYTNNGAVYMFRTDLLFSPEPNFYGDRVAAYPMSEDDSINIDSMADWEAAERIVEKRRQIAS